MLILTSLAGFLAVAALLFTNHPGAAIRVVNYLYFLLLVAVLLKLRNHEVKKS